MLNHRTKHEGKTRNLAFVPSAITLRLSATSPVRVLALVYLLTSFAPFASITVDKSFPPSAGVGVIRHLQHHAGLISHHHTGHIAVPFLAAGPFVFQPLEFKQLGRYGGLAQQVGL